MPVLTRRRAVDRHHVTWHVYYGDVHIGTIGERIGVPVDVRQMGIWSCGFYPGLEPGQHQGGTAPTFFRARADFQDAWSRLLPKIADGALEENRRSTAFHAWKYRMWDCDCRMPTQSKTGRSTFFCGIVCEEHVYTEHMDGR